MQIESITIKNYKAINEVTIRLNKNLIPIVGINEAGKSTILEAIMAFFPENDEHNNGSHLNPTNIYSGHNQGIIEATIKVDDVKELENLYKRSGGNSTIRYLINQHRKELETFKIQRSLPTTDYTIYDTDEQTVLEQSIFNQSPIFPPLFENIPKVIFFENFIDAVDQKIVFERDNSIKKGKTHLESSTYWQLILKEAFTRSNINFENYLTRVEKEEDPSYEMLKSYTQDRETVENFLNNKLGNAWHSITNPSSSYDIEHEKYNIKLLHAYQRDISDNQITHRHIFRIRIVDNYEVTNPTQFSIHQRSKGYQWFCNFMLKLSFNSTYTKKINQAIFLLDEPGSYLHPSAQERLLDQLIELSNQNTIVYSTHLPQLVNPAKIRIHDALVAYRENSDIALKKYGEFGDQQNLGALTTLHNAMKLTLPGIMFPSSTTPFVLTEGITEFYVLEMVKNHTDLFHDINISIVPGQGVTQLQTLISLCIGWSEKYVVIFDKDEEVFRFRTTRTRR